MNELSLEDIAAMTHQPEPPNPAAPWIERAHQFYRGGLVQLMENAGYKLPQPLSGQGALAKGVRSPALFDAAEFWNPLGMKLSQLIALIDMLEESGYWSRHGFKEEPNGGTARPQERQRDAVRGAGPAAR